MPAEWTPHDGGERPIGGEVRVNVRFANGVENLRPLRAGFWNWTGEGQYEYAIVAYRLAPPPGE